MTWGNVSRTVQPLLHTSNDVRTERPSELIRPNSYEQTMVRTGASAQAACAVRTARSALADGLVQVECVGLESHADAVRIAAAGLDDEELLKPKGQKTSQGT